MYFNYKNVCGSCGFSSCCGCGAPTVAVTVIMVVVKNKYSVVDDPIFFVSKQYH
uniref:Keratin associated protein 21-3 n=1 Tax=Saimiri boliviensis boliviensis TaxID=39432 RepID=A0A2K6TUB9_SAIBB